MLDILNEEYCFTASDKVFYYGYSFIEGSFKEYIANKVKPKLIDEEWTQELVNAAVELTGFSADNFAGIFENKSSYSCWRIGEAVAECVLEDSGKARFYYNACRDLKNPRANNTGADLVGFCDRDGQTMFLFGEVKTSSSPETPPSVMYGKSGMIEQLKELLTDESKRNNLIKWITGKINLLPEAFKKDYKNAINTYFILKKVQLVGVLVRDTDPNELDLKNRAKDLEEYASSDKKVWLFALYTQLSMDNWNTAMNGR